MFDTVENIKLLSSYKSASKPSASVEERKSNGFIFRISGEAQYTFHDRSFYVREGEMIFLPLGSSYNYVSYPENESTYVSINFFGDIVNAQPCKYDMGNFSSLDFVYSHFSSLLKIGNAADKYKCLSVFYEILSYLSNVEHTEYQDKHKKNINSENSDDEN